MPKKKNKNEKSKEIRKIKVIKTSLVNITDNNDVIRKINDVVKRCSIITSDIYSFLKLYFLHLYEQKIKLPTVDIDLLATILNVVTIGPSSGRKVRKNNDLNDKISRFYLNNFYKLGHIKEKRDNLSHIYKYLFNSIITNFENNIKLHFENYLIKFLKVYVKSNGIKYENKKIKSLIRFVLKSNDCSNLRSLTRKGLFYIVNHILPIRNDKILIEDINENPQKYLSTIFEPGKYHILLFFDGDKITYQISRMYDNLMSNAKNHEHICIKNIYF